MTPAVLLSPFMDKRKYGFTEMVPVLLQVLNLQLVASLSEDGFGVLLEASRQDSTLPVADVNPTVWIHYS